MESEWVAGIIGGLVGGGLALLSSFVTTYVGPRMLDRSRAREKDEPRKRLLRQLLEDDRFPDGRYLTTLCMYTGTEPEDCRRLLIEIEARGITLEDGEGWVLIKNKPLDQL